MAHLSSPVRPSVRPRSDAALDAVARTLHLSDDEHTYLFDVARAAQPRPAARRRRKAVGIPPRVEWLPGQAAVHGRQL
ncbi:hypothetical protein [Streptomyces sp. NPDC056464]|uniref:hypothetical protein n=1 Tax=Streptomyces sp. NPDC056464 TaxID=3345828 RepID=UPI0036B1A109